MKYLLYHPRSYISARGLSTQLGLKPISLRKVDRLISKDTPPTIRYGVSSHDWNERDTNINSPNVIKICADSLRFSKKAAELSLFTPIYHRFTVTQIPPYPFLLRKRWHRAGIDIMIINNDEELERAEKELGNEIYERYWVPVYKTAYELRVHVVMNNIARIFVKQKTDEVAEDSFIRTSVRGWHYSIRENLDSKYTKAKDIAIHIAETLGLSFGGIDMAWYPDTKQYIIWEVNTAPGLSINTMKVYGDLLRRHV